MNTRPRRCESCRRYLDGLSRFAEPHPVFDTLCVTCGTREAVRQRWSERDQSLREGELWADGLGPEDPVP